MDARRHKRQREAGHRGRAWTIPDLFLRIVLRSIAIGSLVTLGFAQAPPIPSDDCLNAAKLLVGKSSTGSGLFGGAGVEFQFLAGTPTAIREGKTLVIYAGYLGRTGANSSHRIKAWTSNWIKSQPDGQMPPPVTANDIQSCSPNALALICGILAHELLHGKCGNHGDPDCAGVAIRIGVAKILCEIIVALNECFCDPACPPMTSGGVQVPGLSTDADVCALAEALCNRHKDLADKGNSDDEKKKATTCHCDGWSGGPGCPEIPAPAGGCPPSGADDGGFGPGPVVPPCQGCPPCTCGG